MSIFIGIYPIVLKKMKILLIILQEFGLLLDLKEDLHSLTTLQKQPIRIYNKLLKMLHCIILILDWFCKQKTKFNNNFKLEVGEVYYNFTII